MSLQLGDGTTTGRGFNARPRPGTADGVLSGRGGGAVGAGSMSKAQQIATASSNSTCICGSGALYRNCCKLLHDQAKGSYENDDDDVPYCTVSLFMSSIRFRGNLSVGCSSSANDSCTLCGVRIGDAGLSHPHIAPHQQGLSATHQQQQGPDQGLQVVAQGDHHEEQRGVRIPEP